MKNMVAAMLVALYMPVCAGVFENAKWIGAPGDCLPFYPDYLPVFRIDCDVEMSNRDVVSLV